jgi:hypothetical protein
MNVPGLPATGKIYALCPRNVTSASGPRQAGRIANSYSTGTVIGTGENVGGLVGYNWVSDAVTYCLWDTETSGQTTSAGGTDRSTAEIQTARTFLDAGWDFVDETANGTEDIWCICEGQDYPKLAWQSIPGDLNADYNVHLQDLAVLSIRWRSADSGLFWCRGADLTDDGFVGSADLLVLADNWLGHIAP